MNELYVFLVSIYLFLRAKSVYILSLMVGLSATTSAAPLGKPFTNRHQLCVSVLANATQFASIDANKKYVLNAFSSLGQQLETNAPTKVANEELVLIDGLKKTSSEDIELLRMRLRSLNKSVSNLKATATFHIAGEQEISQFFSQLEKMYKLIGQSKGACVTNLLGHALRIFDVSNVCKGVVLSLFANDHTLLLSVLAYHALFRTYEVTYYPLRVWDYKLPTALHNLKSFVNQKEPITRMAYVGFSTFLPEKLISSVMEGQGNFTSFGKDLANLSFNSAGKQGSKPSRSPLSTKTNPQWVGVDLYIDHNGNGEPELFGMIRVNPQQPPKSVEQKQTEKASGPKATASRHAPEAG